MRYIFLVFLGACSYGILSTIVKLAYGQGYSPAEVIGGQMFFGFVLTWIPALFFLRTKPGKKQLLLLVGVGLAVGSTGILYYNALRFIPASIAIVLLFQFTWMGVLAEAILTKRIPDKPTLFSLVLLLFGTLLAGGVWETGGIAQFHIMGVVLGLLSGVSYTLFLLFSGQSCGQRQSVGAQREHVYRVVFAGGARLHACVSLERLAFGRIVSVRIFTGPFRHLHSDSLLQLRHSAYRTGDGCDPRCGRAAYGSIFFVHHPA